MEFSDDARRVRPPAAAAWRPSATSPSRSPLNRPQRGTDVDFGALTRSCSTYLVERGVTTRASATEVTRPDKRVRRQLASRCATAAPATTRKSSTRGSSSSARAAARCRCCRSPASRRSRASAGSRSAASSCAPTTPSWSPQHQAKVYGKAAVGAPPMSVPHLDTRVIDGKSWLLFGPYAGFSPKFLKHGLGPDLLAVGPLNNLGSMLGVGADRDGPGQVPDRRAAAQRRPTGSHALREFAPARRDARLGARHRRPARAGHPAQGQRAACCSSAPRSSRPPTAPSPACSAPRRVPRPRCRSCSTCCERCFPERYRGVAAEAQGDGAVARHRVVERAEVVPGGVGLGHQGAQARQARGTGRCSAGRDAGMTATT